MFKLEGDLHFQNILYANQSSIILCYFIKNKYIHIYIYISPLCYGSRLEAKYHPKSYRLSPSLRSNVALLANRNKKVLPRSKYTTHLSPKLSQLFHQLPRGKQSKLIRGSSSFSRRSKQVHFNSYLLDVT